MTSELPPEAWLDPAGAPTDEGVVRARETVSAARDCRSSGQGNRTDTSAQRSEASEAETKYELAMTDVVARLYVLAICFIGAFLFVAVERLEPNRRFAVVFKCAILAAGGAAIASQLLP